MPPEGKKMGQVHQRQKVRNNKEKDIHARLLTHNY
jgi:hypothetical protein